MREFSINDNKEDTEGIKKVITTTNNKRCKPIKKGKHKINEQVVC